MYVCHKYTLSKNLQKKYVPNVTNVQGSSYPVVSTQYPVLNYDCNISRENHHVEAAPTVQIAKSGPPKHCE
ncbi:unnamed protein product [Gongylonema pulchrum]|uniref:Ovule protein n=1 Tax=Gongylonema pulchrum TaxID=637853 RepID=A0A183DWE0_9BILA|nr:unnamed protein product [Gongylonema pulchrum]